MDLSREMTMTFAAAQLVTKYNRDWDEGRAEGVSACFTPEGVFVDALGNAHEGHAGIGAFVRQSRELFGSMRHLTANHVVEEVSDGWTHHCYVTFVSGIGRPDKALATGYYNDEFVLTDAGPRFRIRRVYLDQ